MVHRLLTRYLDGKPSANQNDYEEKCKHSSEMERLASEAEWASIKYKQVEFLKDEIGQEFDGIVSGMNNWGFFVELADNKCEGMVRLSEIQGDHYFFDEDNYLIAGQRRGKKYQLGDHVRVVIRKADLLRKQVDFELADWED
jgi:ribonuclease R